MTKARARSEESAPSRAPLRPPPSPRAEGVGWRCDEELAYLHSEEFRLARLATTDRAGDPHVVPTGWSYNPDQDTIDIRGMNLEQTHKYRNQAPWVGPKLRVCWHT